MTRVATAVASAAKAKNQKPNLGKGNQLRDTFAIFERVAVFFGLYGGLRWESSISDHVAEKATERGWLNASKEYFPW